MTKEQLKTTINGAQVKFIDTNKDKDEALTAAIDILVDNLADTLSWVGYHSGSTKGTMIKYARVIADKLEDFAVDKYDSINQE